MCTWTPRSRSPPRHTSRAARTSRSSALRPNLLAARPTARPGAVSGADVGVQAEQHRQARCRAPPSDADAGRAAQRGGRSSSADSTATHRSGRPGCGLVDGREQVGVGLADAFERRPGCGDSRGAGARPLPAGHHVGAPAAGREHLGDGRQVVGLERVLPHPRVREGHLHRGGRFGQRGHVDDVERASRTARRPPVSRSRSARSPGLGTGSRGMVRSRVERHGGSTAPFR